MKSFYFIFLFLSALINVNALKVLGILPFPSKSHFAIGYGIVKSLVDAGEIF
jgi:hypothetical protein